MKSGFSSLELIMVIAISAIIMTSLLEIYNQVTRNMIRVERFVFEDMQILTLKNRLGKDFAGLSGIWFTQAQLQAKQAESQKTEKSTQSSEKKQMSNDFYSSNKDENLDMLTFVTTSALQSYVSAQDRFVRVVYKLEQDPKNEKTFRLMRKEITMPTESIDEQALQQGHFYELISGIASLQMTYELIDKVALQKQYEAQEKLKTDNGSNQELQDKQAVKPIIRSVKQWRSDGLQAQGKARKNAQKDTVRDLSDEVDPKEEQQDDLGGAAVPKFVKMKITFAASDQQLRKDYNLEFSIPVTLDNVPKGMLLIKKSTPVASFDGKGAK